MDKEKQHIPPESEQFGETWKTIGMIIMIKKNSRNFWLCKFQTPNFFEDWNSVFFSRRRPVNYTLDMSSQGVWFTRVHAPKYQFSMVADFNDLFERSCLK